MELSAAAQERLSHPRHAGRLTRLDADAAGLELVTTSHGRDTEPDHVELDALVDGAGTIRDLRYRTAARGAEMLLYEVLAERCRGLSLAEAAVVKVDLVQAAVREDFDLPGFVTANHAGPVFPVLEKLARSRHQVAADQREAEWDGISFFEKAKRVEAVLDEHVRPMLASDGGGIDVIDLKDRELTVQYSGACGACSAAMGGTLYFVEETLAEHLGVEIKVVVQGLEGY